MGVGADVCLVHLVAMNPTDASRSRRRLTVIVTTAALVLILVGVGVYGLVTGPRTPDLSLIHISETTRRLRGSRMPSSA